jgi:hypothetical protein
VSGPPSNPNFQNVAVVAMDEFDAWNQARDQFDGNYAGYQYANNQMAGIQDLSQYGNWNNGQYGWGWTPQNMPAGWAPYSNGQWVWEPYYGWTWVDNSSWGWAPYHYGTWLYGNSAWTWYPNAGPQYPSGPYPYVGSYEYGNGSAYTPYPYGYGNNAPYYGYGYPPYATGYPYNYGYPYPVSNSSSLLWAPALVTFLGLLGGENIGTALTTGLASTAMAWTPLAPGEPAYPWWGPQQAAWYGYSGYGYPNYQTYGYTQPVYVQGASQPNVINSYTT